MCAQCSKQLSKHRWIDRIDKIIESIDPFTLDLKNSYQGAFPVDKEVQPKYSVGTKPKRNTDTLGTNNYFASVIFVGANRNKE